MGEAKKRGTCKERVAAALSDKVINLTNRRKEMKENEKETNSYKISLVGNRLMTIRDATMEFIPGTTIVKFDCPERTVWLSPNVWGDICLEKEMKSVVIP